MLFTSPCFVRIPLTADRWLGRETTLSQTARRLFVRYMKIEGIVLALSLQHSRSLREELEIS